MDNLLLGIIIGVATFCGVVGFITSIMLYTTLKDVYKKQSLEPLKDLFSYDELTHQKTVNKKSSDIKDFLDSDADDVMMEGR